MKTQPERIIELREAAGLNNAELAREVPCTRSLISQWQSEPNISISHDKLMGFCKAVGGANPAYVTEGRLPKYLTASTSQAARTASPRTQRLIARLAEADSEGRIGDEDVAALEAVLSRLAK